MQHKWGLYPFALKTLIYNEYFQQIQCYKRQVIYNFTKANKNETPFGDHTSKNGINAIQIVL